MSKIIIQYSQSGESRKRFVQAIASALDVRARYDGAPEFSYTIAFVTVNREGNIEVDEQADKARLLMLLQMLMKQGYTPDNDGLDWIRRETRQMEEATERATEQPNTADSAAGEAKDEQSAEPKVIIDPSDEQTVTTISVPRDIFSETGLENLKKILSAKNELICKALDIQNTEIEVTDSAVSFPWFGELDADEFKYISQFISGLCRFANISKRITSRQRREENPKFAMRTWAIRLGFNGAEYKDLRKYLMKRLPGDAAWRYGRPENDLSAEPTLPISVQDSAQGMEA